MTEEKKNKKHDLVSGIMAYEGGEMSASEERRFLEQNKDTLLQLQGHYGRRLKELGIIK